MGKLNRAKRPCLQCLNLKLCISLLKPVKKTKKLTLKPPQTLLNLLNKSQKRWWSKKEKSKGTEDKKEETKSQLNPQYNYKTCTRSSNQFALASCQTSLKTQASITTPLYGSTGLGKPISYRLAGNHFLRQHPKCVVTYMQVSALNELVAVVTVKWNFRQNTANATYL